MWENLPWNQVWIYVRALYFRLIKEARITGLHRTRLFGIVRIIGKLPPPRSKWKGLWKLINGKLIEKLAEAKWRMFFYLNKAFAGGVPELRFLNLRGTEQQLVSMMDQLTKAFLPWLCVKRWKISYCKSNFPRNRSVYWIKAQVSKESHRATWDGRVRAHRREGCMLYICSLSH